jgi:hypothetical protein
MTLRGWKECEKTVPGAGGAIDVAGADDTRHARLLTSCRLASALQEEL